MAEKRFIGHEIIALFMIRGHTTFITKPDMHVFPRNGCSKFRRSKQLIQ